MDVLIKIYCGESIRQWCVLDGLHPIKQLELAKQQIETLLHIKSLELESHKTMWFNTNLPDFTSALYYMAEKHNIPCEIYLDNKLSTLEDVFNDWNRFYDLLDKELV